MSNKTIEQEVTPFKCPHCGDGLVQLIGRTAYRCVNCDLIAEPHEIACLDCGCIGSPNHLCIPRGGI